RNDRVRDLSIKIFNVIVFAMPMMFLVMYASMVAVLWFGGNQIMEGRMLAGDLIGFLTYITQIFISLTMLTMLLVNYVRAKASAVRCLDVIETPLDLVSPDDGIRTVDSGDIRFENVSFRYAGMSEDSLKNIEVEIKAGETIGIIGSTGSSKTTLVSLLSRLYDVREGRVLVGGTDVRDYDLTALRDGVSVVLQQNTLFSGTLRDNMRFGNEHATDEEIWEALEIASAKDFVLKKENGLDFEVEAEGGNFSGGQRQRLTIARALLKKPKILILDDAMSAVDMATERRLKQSLTRAIRDVTVLIIAQRISSVSDADRIIVMADGRIDSIGDHETLLRTNVIYREVYESQQQGLAS
ncbi:MAG TPA: ABC transporter ATP-binding protein, partial [Clostridiaceae bacterium]|nr:ABC transporter ATP-binding protein [Clostridiaceae bacterium]